MAGPRVSVTRDRAALRARAGTWLEADPVGHNLFATAAGGSAAGVFAWADDAAGELAGVALRTGPYPALLDATDAAAAGALVGALLDAGESFDGLSGPEPGAGHAVAAWRERTGGSAAARIRMQLLATAGPRVIRPARAPAGGPREPRPADRDLLIAWATAFVAETGAPGHAGAAADSAIADGRSLIWERDGQPVSVASHAEPVAGVIRVVFVYTPPQERRQGLAAAVVAAVCERGFAAGARRAALYADRGDPTATGVYTRLGFAPCGEATFYGLTR